MKRNIGILIFTDPTRGGTIASEVKFLSSLHDFNKDECDFFVLTVNPSITKRVIKEKNTSYNFPHEIIPVFNESQFDILSKFSAIVTYPGHSNFFGGYLNDNVTKMYKIVSKCTNELKIPVFVRINDSEIKVRDYRRMSEIRLGGKEESAFMKDPANVAKARDLVSWKEWDYTKVFWFANGSKDACDWVAETMYDREDDAMKMAPRQIFVDNAIYVSDDIFFLIRKNYERFDECYTKNKYDTKKSQFGYIGFFDTVNVMRAKAFTTIFKENKYAIPMKIFGKGTEILKKIQGKANIDIEEGFIKGDSQEYFDFLNEHLAYLFIGKGQAESRYIGKTAYDAVVAKTPIAVYKKCDIKMITFSNPEYYFENEYELNEIYKKLNDPVIRQQWIEAQKQEIFAKLPPSEFRFSKYSELKSEISSESFLKNVDLIREKKSENKEIVTSVTALF